ncbi:MAG: YerC/YecD family TrpR-related protein [Aquisalinus sp.]|nr:YerC/YecD family TrpR-related protein [Aquisalinus sp.]
MKSETMAIHKKIKATGSAPPGSEEVLYSSLASMESADDAKRFLADLCTPSEIRALSERWHVARLLDETDLSYREIHQQTGVSTTTIARVARFLNNEPHQGYRLMLDRLKGEK